MQVIRIPSPKVSAYPPRAITIYAFRNRFTQTEKVKLELASIHNPEAPLNLQQAAAVLRVFLDDVAVARYIDLDLPQTRAGVMLLEQIGILDAGRATTIVDSRVLDVERLEPTGIPDEPGDTAQIDLEDPAPQPSPAPTPP